MPKPPIFLGHTLAHQNLSRNTATFTTAPGRI